MAKHYDNWKDDDYDCFYCGKTWKGSECPQGEMFDDLVEMDCPECNKSIFIVEFPTLQEMRDNWANLSKAEKGQVFFIENHELKFEMTSLKSEDQLPDVEGDDLILVWDIEDRQSGGNTLIKFGDRIIWEETAWFEGYERFIKVANILKEKYRERLQDLVPTRKSKLYLYGDSLAAQGRVDECRKDIGKYWAWVDESELPVGFNKDSPNQP